MKRLILVAFVISFALNAFCQPGLSFKLGYHYSQPALKTTSSFYKPDSRNSYQVYALLNFNIKDIFILQSGLGLIDKSFYLKDYPYTPPAGFPATITYDVSPLYLEMPLTFIKKYNVGKGRIAFGAGPYAAIGVSGTMITDYSYGYNGYLYSPSHSISYGNDANDDMKKLDFGFNLNAAYEFDKNISVGLNYGRGITNLFPRSDPEAKHRLIAIQVGVSL